MYLALMLTDFLFSSANFYLAEFVRNSPSCHCSFCLSMMLLSSSLLLVPHVLVQLYASIMYSLSIEFTLPVERLIYKCCNPCPLQGRTRPLCCSPQKIVLVSSAVKRSLVVAKTSRVSHMSSRISRHNCLIHPIHWPLSSIAADKGFLTFLPGRSRPPLYVPWTWT